MATEILAISEEQLLEVLRVIRAGLGALPDVPDDLRAQLLAWCAAEEEYLGEDGS